jgi:cytochrome c biogenesis protein CcmG/thiol:disulfide interchange protein DsbE
MDGSSSASVPRVHKASANTNRLLFALLGLLTITFLGLATWSIRDTSAHEGGPAPLFHLKTDQGMVVSPEDFGGKVLVLNFWATWCAPCVREIPSLEQLQREFRDQGVVVVAVSIDKNESKYKNFLNRFRVSFDTARDPSADISSSYGTYQIPETYIIKDGKVVRKLISEQNWVSDDSVQFIKSLL